MTEIEDSSLIEDSKWYSAAEAVQWLDITAFTLKNKLRDGTYKGQKRGIKRIWHVQGKEIKRIRKEYNLD